MKQRVLIIGCERVKYGSLHYVDFMANHAVF